MTLSRIPPLTRVQYWSPAPLPSMSATTCSSPGGMTGSTVAASSSSAATTEVASSVPSMAASASPRPQMTRRSLRSCIVVPPRVTPNTTVAPRAASRNSFGRSCEQEYPLIRRFPRCRVVLDDAQAMAPDERQDLVARHVAEMLMSRPGRPVGGGDLLRLAEHGERDALDEEERPRGREQPRHARQRLVDVGDVVQGAQAENLVVARGFSGKVLDVARVQASVRDRRAQTG